MQQLTTIAKVLALAHKQRFRRPPDGKRSHAHAAGFVTLWSLFMLLGVTSNQVFGQCAPNAPIVINGVSVGDEGRDNIIELVPLVSGGSGSYIYAWEDPAPNNVFILGSGVGVLPAGSTAGTSATSSETTAWHSTVGLAASPYTVNLTVTDAGNAMCNASISLTVTDVTPNAVSITINQNVCVGETVTYNLNPAMASYTWNAISANGAYSSLPSDGQSEDITWSTAGNATFSVVATAPAAVQPVSATITYNVTINAVPTATVATLEECATTGGGTTADFTLTDADATVDGAGTNTVTYHANQTDADNDANALTSPYTSATGSVIARVENASGCYATSTVTLTVDPTPIASVATLEECATTPGGTTADFTLTDADATVDGAGTNTVTYHANQTDADNDANALTSPYTSATGSVIARVENADGCYSTSTVTLTVDATPIASAETLEECATTPGGTTADFTLTDADATVDGAGTNTVTYHANQTDADNDVNVLTSPYTSATGSVIARVESADGCYSTSTVTLTVNPTPIASPATLEVCATTAGGTTGSFTLTDADGTVDGAGTNTVTYHANQTDADNGVNALTSPYISATGSVIARVENADGCYSTSTVTLTVDPTPVASVATLEVCSTAPGGLTGSFTLTDADATVDGAGTNTVTYHTSLIDAQAGAGALTSPYVAATGSITARVENADGCFSTAPVTLTVNTTPVASVATIVECETTPAGGQADFTLTDADATVDGAGTNTVTYHANQTDADNDVNPISSPYTSTAGSVIARVESADGCYSTATITLTVDPTPTATVATLEECATTPGGTTADFTLTDADGVVDAGANTVTYHANQTDADNDNSPLSSPYNSASGSVVARVENADGCYSTSIVTLTVNKTPISSPASIEVCPDAASSLTGNFTLTSVNTTVDGGGGNTVSYHATQMDADNDASPLASPYNATSGTVVARVEDPVTGCYSTSTVTLTVQDVIPPTITCPSPAPVASDGTFCSAVVNGLLPTTGDNCGIASVTYNTTGATTTSGNTDASGTTFNVGSTIVKYTVTDFGGNVESCDFTVTVNDTELPTISCPADIVQDTDPGVCEAVVTWTVPVGMDNCPSPVTTQILGPAPGGTFPKGATSVAYEVEDASGLKANCSFIVTIEDNEDPQFAGCPMDATIPNTVGNCGASYTWVEPVESDNCPGVTVTKSHNPGDFFPVGTTTVTYTAEDAEGNTVVCEFDVTVQDTEVPQLTGCPVAPIVVPNDNDECGAIVNWTDPTATDNCPGVTLTSTHNPGDFFLVGTTTVTYTAEDTTGNTTPCSFDITVNDTQDPVIVNCPADQLTVSVNPGACEASVVVPVPVPGVDFTDNCPNAKFINDFNNTANASDIYPVGTTNVIWTLTDSTGNFVTCTQIITVIDDEKPTITCPPNIDVNNTPGACDAVVSWPVPVGMDNCPLPITNQIAGPAPGTAFVVGAATTITYVVTDAAANADTCSFTVTVNDTEDPEIACPADFDVSADAGECGAVVNYTAPIGTDNCPNPMTALIGGLGDGAFFPVGLTTETYEVTDASGNKMDCSFTVEVIDNEAPVIDCPINIVQDVDAGQCDAVVTWTIPTPMDNCGAIISSASHTPGMTFPLGTTTVTYIATDTTGNADTCSFTITINDNELPVINCPANITVNNDAGVCGAVVTYTVPVGTDNCGASTTQTAGLGSGATFPVGVTTETFTATDAANNSASCSFTITVTDDEDPEISCPANIVVSNTPGQCGAVVTYAVPTATDNCTGVVVALTNGPASGATFPIGTTTIVHTATDASNNTADCSFTITVNDTEDPVINCPAPITVFNDAGFCGAIIDWTIPTPSDNCPNVNLTSASHTPGTFFAVGVTPVSYEATDASGNTAVCSFNITINDGEQPEIDCPTDIVVDNDAGICGAVVTYVTPVGTDNCPGQNTSLTAGLASGATFPIGNTLVTYEVTDAALNKNSCSFTVTVNDTEDPTISCPADITVNNDAGLCGAGVTYTPPVGNDNCPGEVTAQTAGLGAGSFFPVGITTESYTVTDATGNTASCSFTVTVNDNEPPTIACPAGISKINDDNLCGAVINDIAATGMDNCPGAVFSYTTSGPAGFTASTNPEDASGSFFPVGVTTVTYTHTDSSGNAVSCSFNITITDDEAPDLTCPTGITVNTDPGSCTAIVDYTVTANDNCDGPITPLRTAGSASGSAFNLGIHTITHQATDLAGNTSMCTFEITVEDNEMPVVVECPGDITVDNDAGECSAIIAVPIPTFGPTGNFNDNCPNNVTLTNDFTNTNDASGTYPVGVTLVTWTATDEGGNTVTCVQTITVNDTQDPVLTCPSAISQGVDAGECGAIVTGLNPAFGDNCPTPTLTYELTGATTGTGNGSVDGFFFNVGETTVIYTVTDAAGNSVDCTTTVTIVDDEDPVIDCRSDIIVPNDMGACNAVVTGIAPTGADDNCPGETISYTLSGATTGTGNDDASGTTFNIGTTTVEYTITDAAGNTAACSFTVTVEDTESPVISCPNDVVADSEAGQCSAVVNDIAPIGLSDNCTGLTVTYTLTGATTGSGNDDASGVTFNVGETTVTYTVTDSAGNPASCSFTVTVNDVEDPQILCPQNIVIDADQGECGAQVIYLTPGVFDNCPNPTLALTDGLASGSIFPVDTTTVIYTATDAAGNTASCSFTVIVQDNEDPVIDCPADVVVPNDPGECTAVVSGISPTGASDNCPDFSMAYELTGATIRAGAGDATGETFNLGETTVTYTITDASGNTATCSFTVTVEDTQAPVVVCPGNVLQNVDAALCGAVVENIDPNISDNCPDPTVAYQLTGATTGTGNGSASGLTFDVGTTTVLYTVTDAAGNIDTCSFQVTIIDNQDPLITCPDDVTVTADFGFCDAFVEDIDPIISDNCPNPTISYTLSGATNTTGLGSASGELFDLGVTTVTYTVTDGAGNTATCSFTVTVVDIQDPIVVCPGSLTIPLGTNGQVFVPQSLFFFDDNCGVASAEITPQILDCSNLGSNIVTLTVTDLAGNTAFCSTTITVIDNQPPDIVCRPDMVVPTDAGECTATINDLDLFFADDNCELVSLTYSLTGATTGAGLNDASGNVFNVGVTTVTYTATDAQGQVATCSFTVTVEDQELPTIVCPDPVTQSTDADACSATVVGITPTSIADNCDTNLTLTYTLSGATTGTGQGDASGESFNLGVTTVTYIVVDDGGNQASCSFDITVEDNTDPVLICPENVIAEITIGCDAVISDIAPIQATDNCDAAPLLTYTLTGATTGQGFGDASGNTFNIGITTVAYTLEDENGNVVTCSFDVTVEDNIDPTITCPDDIEVVAQAGECGAVVTFNAPLADDNCSGVSVSQIEGFASGTEFPVGTTTVTFEVTDASGNTNTCSFNVTVLDEEDPVILCPTNIIVSVDEGQCGAVVDYPGVSVADNCPNPEVSLVSGFGDGAFFPVGEHTEVYEVSDLAGNTATCNFIVTVVDDEFPTITCPQDVVVPNDSGLCSAVVIGLAPIANDNCPNWTVTYTLDGATTGTGTEDASGSVFNVGETTVTYTIIDDAGNVTNCEVSVTVEDKEAPTIECPVDVMVDVISTDDCFAVVNYGGVQTNDNCPSPVTITLIEGIEDGGQFPVGVTTVVYEAADVAGNQSMCTFTVTVNGPSGVTIAAINTPDPQEICEGDTLDIAANVPGAMEAATWSSMNGGTFLPSASSPVAQVIDLPAGPNMLTWTITDGCGVSTATLQVTVNPKPTGVIFEASPISAWDAEDGVLLAIGQDGTPPDYSFIWNTGATTNSIGGLGPDTYSVVISDSEGCTSDTISYDLIAPPAPTVLVDVKVMLQGAYNVQSGLMDDNLRTLPDFPLEEPYTDLGFTHEFGGKETIDPSVLVTTGSNAVIDWIFLELRDPIDPTIIISTRSALVLADGSVVDVDGFSPVAIVGTPGDYHVAVRHRNHLGAMTLNPVTLDVTIPATTVDFADPAGTPTFGTNALQSALTPVRTLWAGNASGDGSVILAGGLSDVNPISLRVFLDPGNVTFSSSYAVPGYFTEDVNMSGDVILAGSNSDVNIISLNVFLHPENGTFSSSYPIMQQLP